MTDGEGRAINRLIDFLGARGWTLHSVSDGEERIKAELLEGREAVLEHVSAADEGFLYFVHPEVTRAATAEIGHPTMPRHSVLLVFGNDPDGFEVAADHAAPVDLPRFAADMDAWYEREEAVRDGLVS